MTRTNNKNGDEAEIQGDGQRSRLAETIQAWIIVRLSDELKVAPAEIDTRKPLLSYGLDSVIAFSLMGELADLIGRELPVTLFWDLPTLEALAFHVVDTIEDAAVAESLLGEMNRALSLVEEPPVDEFSKSAKKQN